MKKIRPAHIFAVALFCLTAFIVYDANVNYVNWRTADRSSAGLAPDPKLEKDAVVQVYAARTYNWRGYFAVHPWIAVKKKNADFYTVYQVTAWNLRREDTAVSVAKDIPDRNWYGKKPELLQSLIGKEAERAIPAIEKAVEEYPFADRYTLWPGPNSNTFVAHILREVPELTVELPPTAVGKDFLGTRTFWAPTASGSGYQFSLFGLLSLTVGLREGVEIGLLGLAFGLDFYPPAIKLPLIGRLGFADR